MHKTEKNISLVSKLYEKLFLIRKFEEEIEPLFQKNELFGTVHCCNGQEAVAVGIISALAGNDIVVSNHRGHGHYIAYSDDIYGLLAELMGRATGISGGRGGSQHLQYKNFYSNGITGGMTAVAAGMAMAEKMKNSNSVVVSFIGDGAFGQGVLYESLNMVSLWDIPILYIVENNFYAMSTHISRNLAGSFEKRAEAFSIRFAKYVTSDVMQIYDIGQEALKYVRENNKPSILAFDTYRFCGHSKSDGRAYRTKEEEVQWLKKCPIEFLRPALDKKIIAEIENRCIERISKAIDRAKKDGFPKIC
jgi:2-oxoisovalerate dehydrogenase E1 component